MSREAPQWNVGQLRNELESYERTTKAAYERLRAVVYSNKKELETPIYQNKLELGRLEAVDVLRCFACRTDWYHWMVGLENVQLNQEIVALSTTFKDLEARSVRELSRVEVAVEALQNAEKVLTYCLVCPSIFDSMTDTLPPLVMYTLMGITFGLAGGLSPGPLTALLIRQTMNQGFRAGAVVAAVPIITDIPMLIIFCSGVGTVVKNPIASDMLTLIGAIFLFYLAIETWRSSGQSLVDSAERARGLLACTSYESTQSTSLCFFGERLARRQL